MAVCKRSQVQGSPFMVDEIVIRHFNTWITTIAGLKSIDRRKEEAALLARGVFPALGCITNI
jgi:hypothetical protein